VVTLKTRTETKKNANDMRYIVPRLKNRKLRQKNNHTSSIRQTYAKVHKYVNSDDRQV